jgi:simple sugar transport system ATP-binding protein
MAPALELSGITKSFGDFLALAAANLSVDFGEVHALLGENGAGKSSLMNVAAGLYSPDSGSIEVAGVPCRFLGPRESMRHGIGMIHQNFKLVKRFTVAENVLLANPRGSFSGGKAAIEREIKEKAEALGFALDPGRRVDSLAIAEQQRVEIIKALVAGARILFLDEPTAVLTEGEAQRLLAMVRDIAEQGGAVILVTHKLRDVRTFAHRLTIMRGGKTVGTVDPRQTTAEELTRLMVGSNVVDPSRCASPGSQARRSKATHRSSMRAFRSAPARFTELPASAATDRPSWLKRWSAGGSQAAALSRSKNRACRRLRLLPPRHRGNGGATA